MLYAQIDLDLPDDPKIVAAGAVAEHAYIRIILRCKRHLTDGVIDRRVAALWLHGLRGRPADIMATLERNGLVEEHPDGWRIPPAVWAKRNDSAATIEAKRSTKRASGALGNHERWHASKGITDPACPHCTSIAPSSQTDRTCESHPIAPDRHSQRQIQSHSHSHAAAASRDTQEGIDPALNEAAAAAIELLVTHRITHPDPDAPIRSVARYADQIRTGALAEHGHVIEAHTTEILAADDPAHTIATTILGLTDDQAVIAASTLRARERAS